MGTGRVIAGAAACTALIAAGCDAGRGAERDAAPAPPRAGAAKLSPFASVRAWTRLPRPPFARSGAAVVWTGRALAYWGGETSGGVPATGGAVYDGRARRWTALPPAPMPARSWPAAAWTGKEVLIWGGMTRSVERDDGAAYEPSRRRWRRLPTAPLSGRAPAVAVWTGSELVVWGNTRRTGAVGDGAAYDPRRDRWRRIPDAPRALNQATAAWTGREVVVLGSRLDGRNHSASAHAQAMAYDPARDRWRRLPKTWLSPQASSLAWSGRDLVAWDYGTHARTYAGGRWDVVPAVPLRPAECYPRSVAVAGTVLGWFCGQAAVWLPRRGIWSRVPVPPSAREAEPVAAGRVVMLVGRGRRSLWALRPPDRPEPVRLVPLAPSIRARCRSAPLLRAACPERVPEVLGRWTPHLSMALIDGMEVFNLEHGGEWPGRPERNRPPSTAHLVVVGGHIGGISPSGDPPCRRTEPLRDGVMRRQRGGVVCFGRVHAGRRHGDLFLAPGFPLGGVLGNHLVFRWREAGRRYTLSLHGWEPLSETAATLRRMATPRDAGAR